MSKYTRDSYNEIHYESASIPEAHLDRLWSTAQMFGIQAAVPDRCEVLEIGCAAGGNLIPLAYQFRESEFLGIDLAEKPLELAMHQVKQLELSNITFRHLDILEMNQVEKRFDYIIAHGLHSWLPATTRSALLQLGKTHLKENGIFYISYNALPGWYEKLRIRDLLLYFTRNATSAAERVKTAREYLERYEEFCKGEKSEIDAALRPVVSELRKAPDWYLQHEYLSEINEPYSFERFLSEAKEVDLAYIADADLSTSSNIHLETKDYAPGLSSANRFTAEYEQAYDFFTNRMFRRSLLSLSKPKLLPDNCATFLKKSFIASPAKKVRVEPLGTNFSLGDRGSIIVREPATASALQKIGDLWPQNISFSTLQAELQESSEEEKTQVVSDLVELFLQGALFIDSREISNSCQEVPLAPMVSSLSQYQASVGAIVSGVRAERISLNAVSRVLTALFDGQSTQEDLFGQLRQVEVSFVDNGEDKEIDLSTIDKKTFDALYTKLTLRFLMTGVLQRL